tara:strand:+ start:307 stop:1323 length:1017 start_codon:yes stop_codon:yes gene_type:complete
MEDAKVKFFNIESCGYHEWGNQNPSFGNMEEIISQLTKWGTDGRHIKNTKTYQPDPSKDIYNTYFCECKTSSNGSDIVLVLWNEVKNDNGAIYGISPTNQPGQNSILTSGFSANKAIPGFPSYFWIMPRKSIIASITFDHSVQGKANLERYLAGFMKHKSEYRVKDKDGKITNYTSDGQHDDSAPKHYQKLRITSVKSKDLEDNLLDNQQKIRKFIRKEKMDYTLKDSRDLMEKAFSRLTSNTPKLTQERISCIEIPFQPTPAQIRSIIKNYENLSDSDPIKDVGFELKGGKRLMLGGMFITEDIKFQIIRNSNTYLPSNTLLHEVLKNKITLTVNLP